MKNYEKWEMRNNVTERNWLQQRNSHRRQKMSEIVRCAAESQTAVNENGRLTEPLQITVV